MAAGSKSDWINLYDALLDISQRLDATAVAGSQKAIFQLTRALYQEKLAAKCDFAEAPVGWEPNEATFRMPVRRTRRMDVPAPRWDGATIYWRASMLCDHQQDCTDVFGHVTLRKADINRLWPQPKPDRSVSRDDILRFVRTREQLGGPIPSQETLYREAKEEFPDRNIDRQFLRDTHRRVFGKLPTGPRKKSAD